MESRASTLEDLTQCDFKELRVMQLQVRWLQEWAIDTENHLRLNNIRTLGLPERAEGTKPNRICGAILYYCFEPG